jgi:hypothetical protein
MDFRSPSRSRIVVALGVGAGFALEEVSVYANNVKEVWIPTMKEDRVQGSEKGTCGRGRGQSARQVER